MTSINKNTVKEHITDALIADLSTTVAKLQKDCGIMEDNINKLFQLIGKQEEQKVDSPNSDLESSKKNKNITEWLINIYEMGNVPNEVVKILRKGMGVTMEAYKKSHKKEIDAKEGKEIKILIGLIMRDLNNTSTMTELIDLYNSINKEVDDTEDESDDDTSKKSPPAKKVVAKKTVAFTKKAAESSSESEDDESEEEVATSPKKITSKPAAKTTTTKPTAKVAAAKTTTKVAAAKTTAAKTATAKTTAAKKKVDTTSDSSSDSD